MEVDNLLRVAIGSSGLAGLQSKKSIQRLEQISSLRARGISNSIDLPQLAVCGDQSCGKSSTLEGLTNIPFPRADGVCTKVSAISCTVLIPWQALPGRTNLNELVPD